MSIYFGLCPLSDEAHHNRPELLDRFLADLTRSYALAWNDCEAYMARVDAMAHDEYMAHQQAVIDGDMSEVCQHARRVGMDYKLANEWRKAGNKGQYPIHGAPGPIYKLRPGDVPRDQDGQTYEERWGEPRQEAAE